MAGTVLLVGQVELTAALANLGLSLPSQHVSIKFVLVPALDLKDHSEDVGEHELVAVLGVDIDAAVSTGDAPHMGVNPGDEDELPVNRLDTRSDVLHHVEGGVVAGNAEIRDPAGSSFLDRKDHVGGKDPRGVLVANQKSHGLDEHPVPWVHHLVGHIQELVLHGLGKVDGLGLK